MGVEKVHAPTCSMMEHTLRTPLCQGLSTWQKVSYFAAFLFIGVISLFTAHLVYNLCLRKTSAKSEESVETPPDKKESPPKFIQLYQNSKNSLNYLQFTFPSSIPPLVELASNALFRFPASFVRMQKVPSNSRDPLLSRCEHLDLTGCKISNADALLTFLENHAPNLTSLSLWNSALISVTSFRRMSEKCTQLAILDVAFETTPSYIKAEGDPFIYCKNLCSLRYSIAKCESSVMKTVISQNRFLCSLTIHCDFVDETLTKGVFDVLDHDRLQSVSIVASFEKCFPKSPYLSVKHPRCPISFSISYIEASRALVSLALLTEENFKKQFKDRSHLQVSKNFNPTAFSHWLLSVKHNPEKIKNLVSSMLFHAFAESDVKESLSSLAVIFIEQLSLDELARVAPLLMPIVDEKTMTEIARYNEQLINFLLFARNHAFRLQKQFDHEGKELKTVFLEMHKKFLMLEKVMEAFREHLAKEIPQTNC